MRSRSCDRLRAAFVVALAVLLGAVSGAPAQASFVAVSTTAMGVSTPTACARDGHPYDPYSQFLSGHDPLLRWTFGDEEIAELDGVALPGSTGASPAVGFGPARLTDSQLQCGASRALRVLPSGQPAGVRGTDVPLGEQFTTLLWVQADAPGALAALRGPSGEELRLDVSADLRLQASVGEHAGAGGSLAGSSHLVAVAAAEDTITVTVDGQGGVSLPWRAAASADVVLGADSEVSGATATVSDLTVVGRKWEKSEITSAYRANHW